MSVVRENLFSAAVRGNMVNLGGLKIPFINQFFSLIPFTTSIHFVIPTKCKKFSGRELQFSWNSRAGREQSSFFPKWS